ncbi:YgfZ/GcvT domain-containing protein [Methylophaga sp. OBS4]|uniref:CAF17-like 4Fe-4S cluster assembly/insertion protein YgfZ n=1 Tax=Methylophaga sp. OBS4 TaxID=2991935 RepID=UPI00225A9781|nr:hypothetical protein [Methylophaga sp. OBS4]MCX4188307.1 hypothetical protein [Methylophaga sp. OBS4]
MKVSIGRSFLILCYLCTAHGCAVLQLIRRQQDYLIVLPAELADSIFQRLKMFILRSKVSLEMLSDEQVLFGLVEPVANDGLDLPASDWFGEKNDNSLIIKQAGNPNRYLVLATAQDAAGLADKLFKQGWQIGAENLWQYLDIKAGLPMVFLQSKEQFTPQQVNLDLVGGVSFKKGCYPGQEVVARLHYLGSPSRRMFLAVINTDLLPEPGTAVKDAAGETLGHVVQAQFASENEVLCQLSMKLSATDRDAFINEAAVAELTALAEEE